MMKKTILFVVSIFVLSAVLLTGCSEKDSEPVVALDQPYNVTFVLAKANNQPMFEGNQVEEFSNLSKVAGTIYSVVEADGTPSVCMAGVIPDFTEQQYSTEMISRANQQVYNSILTKLSGIAPDSNQVDLAAAISTGVRSLRSTEEDGRENLFVMYTSGISTSGMINMVDVPASDLDVDKSADEISQTLGLDMTGIHVIFYALGNVSGDQPALSENERRILEDFYTKLFENMNATITFVDCPTAEGSYNYQKTVSTMKTEEVNSGLKPTTVGFENDANGTSNIDQVFDTGDVLSLEIFFEGDSTEFTNKDAASETLSYVADYMKKNTDFQLTILATTAAAGNPDQCKAFSKKRGSKVKELLCSDFDISEDRIQVFGCGYSSSLYIPDTNADGSLIEQAAALNRTVKMADSNSTTTQDIINSIKS